MNPVNPTLNDRDGQYYESLLGAAAFGTLTAGEEAELRAWLATTPAARAELAELRLIAGDLSLLADEMEPSPGLRHRIEQAVLTDVAWAQPQADASGAPIRPLDPHTETEPGEPRPLDFTTQPATTRRRRAPNLQNYIWAAAASLLIAVLAGVVLDRMFLQDAGDDADNRQVIAFDLTLATPIPELSAELTYDPDRQLFVLETENMPAAPEGQIYQIWLINEAGPKPVGIMDQPTFAVAADRSQYQAFAITVEPGPIGSPGPTTEPFFVAPLTPEDNET